MGIFVHRHFAPFGGFDHGAGDTGHREVGAGCDVRAERNAEMVFPRLIEIETAGAKENVGGRAVNRNGIVGGEGFPFGFGQMIAMGEKRTLVEQVVAAVNGSAIDIIAEEFTTARDFFS